MRKYVLIALAAGSVALFAGGYPAQARPVPRPYDATPETCNVDSLVPAAVHLPVLDPSDEIQIDLFMVGDRGISEYRLHDLAQQAQKAYEPLGLQLNVVGTKEVSFTGGDVEELFTQTKALFPKNERPAGSDAVILATSTEMTSGLLGSSVAGVADCVGGVEFPTTAFALVEDDQDDKPISLFGVDFSGHTPAKIMAHELAHLLGAHHQYANCAEGLVYEIDELEASPCSLMINDIGLASLGMSVLEGTAVRGYADLYARP